jgi:hypothetical protein
MNKLIILIFLILIILDKSYSQTLTEQEKFQYSQLVFYIKDIYGRVRNTVSFLHKYKNYKLSTILWSHLANYEEYLPSVNSKNYNDPRGLIITLWGVDEYRYFGSIKNDYYQGLFAIEFYISNTITYKYKKYIYYLLDQEIDYKVNLSQGKLVTGKPGINPLIQPGGIQKEIQNLGDDSNFSSIYILCY